MKSNKIMLASMMALSAGLALAHAQSGLSGKIVYSLNGDLWLHYFTGVPDVQVTATPDVTEWQPRLSPDGGRIAAKVSPAVANGPSGLRVFSLNGGLLVTLTTAAMAAWPTWSNDGERIAYSDSTRNVSGIWVTRANGSTIPTRLTDHGAFPAWSPVINADGTTQIAFTSSKGTKSGDAEIWLMDVTIAANGSVSASGAAPILSFKGNDGDLDWKSPGLTFTHYTGPTYSQDIYTMNPVAPGSTVIRLTQLTSGDVESRWSPDGTKLLFRRSSNDPSFNGLWVIDAFLGPGGSLPTPTILIPGGGQADWGP